MLSYLLSEKICSMHLGKACPRVLPILRRMHNYSCILQGLFPLDPLCFSSWGQFAVGPLSMLVHGQPPVEMLRVNTYPLLDSPGAAHVRYKLASLSPLLLHRWRLRREMLAVLWGECWECDAGFYPTTALTGASECPSSGWRIMWFSLCICEETDLSQEFSDRN